MTIAPKGDEFLERYTVKELTKLYRQEKEPKAKVRLLAAMLRKEGKTLTDIAEMVKHPFTTVGDWLRRMHNEGLSGRYNIKQTGRPRRLTEKQMVELDQMFCQPPSNQGLPFTIWSTKLACHAVKNTYGVTLKPRQMRNIMHTLQLSPQKPRPSHRKANKKLQDAFKKTSGKQFDPTLRMDMRSSCWTKASSR